jgi:hypothetical protein
MEKNNTLAIFLAFVVGVMVGRNWDKLKGIIAPLIKDLQRQYGGGAGFEAFARQREQFEDMILRTRSSNPRGGRYGRASHRNRGATA